MRLIFLSATLPVASTMASIKPKPRSNAQRLGLETINIQKQLAELSKLARTMGYSSIADVLVTQSNVSIDVPAFRRQLLQNTAFVSLVTEFLTATVKQEMDAVLRNPYFKLPANNITLSTLEEFSLEKIDSNIKADASFLHSLIREAAGVEIVNTADCDSDTSATTYFAANSKENLHFRNSQSENNISDQYNSSNESNGGLGSDESDSDPDVVQKGHRDRRQNKTLIATVSFGMLAYARNKYANLLQMVTGYFSFAHNVSKRGTEVYHKMGLVVSYKTVRRALNPNGQAVLRILRERVNVEQFFLSYDNMNFYEKV